MMSVSFDVKLTGTGDRTARFLSRPCFASINSAVSWEEKREGTTGIVSVKYIPFFQKMWDEDTNASKTDYSMDRNMTWEVAERYWEYLMSLKFITDALVKIPESPMEMRQGFEIKAQLPADRVMVTLFLLRAPQYQPGIVVAWDSLVTVHDIHKDTAFVTALALNNYSTIRRVEWDEYGNEYLMNAESSSENSIIYPEYFTLRSARIMLNRLLCDDYDEKLFSGIQQNLSEANEYKRYDKTDKRALGRFLCKKPGRTEKTKNLQVLFHNFIKIDSVDTHSRLYRDLRYSYMGRAEEISSSNAWLLAQMIEG